MGDHSGKHADKDAYWAHVFDTRHLKDNIVRKSVRGGSFNLIAQVVTFSVEFGATVVLARLLSVDDFGLVGMAMIVVGFSTLFVDAGLSTATIQRQTLTHGQVSTLFWANVGIALVIALIVAVSGPLIAGFYKRSELIPIVTVLAVPIAINGFVIQHRALLARQMRFRVRALITVIAAIGSVAVALAMALMGSGYWALVWRPFVSAVFVVAGTWMACRWIPSRPGNLRSIRDLLGFGGKIAAANIINYFSRNADNVLVGRFCGTATLGFYMTAYKMVMLPINQLRMPLQTALMPAMSTLQDDPVRFRNMYVRFIQVLSMVFMPIMVVAAVFAEEVITLVLGAKWLESAWMFRVFAIVGFIHPVATTRGLVMIASGLADRHLAWMTIFSFANVGAFAIGIFWGVQGVLVSYVVVNYVLLVFSMSFCFRGTAVAPADFYKGIALPAVSSLVTAIVAVALKFSGVGLFLAVSLAGLSYLLQWMIVPEMRKRLFHVTRLVTASHSL